MNLDFAVDRLYEVGWTPADDSELERLPDGRRMPTVSCVKREFDRVGLELSIQHTPKFHCYRATWKPTAMDIERQDAAGTIVAAGEREAAVYALAQLHAKRAREQQQNQQSVGLA